MKKIVMVIAQEGFRDEELFEPKEVLEERGCEVKIASKTKEKAQGKLGGEAMPDFAISEISPADFDAIVFVGGPGAQIYLDDSEIHKLAQDFSREEKIVAAICISPSILANAGLLRGVEATAFESEAENLKDKGAVYTGSPVEVSGKIVTADGPAAAKEFGEKIADVLGL